MKSYKSNPASCGYTQKYLFFLRRASRAGFALYFPLWEVKRTPIFPPARFARRISFVFPFIELKKGLKNFSARFARRIPFVFSFIAPKREYSFIFALYFRLWGVKKVIFLYFALRFRLWGVKKGRPAAGRAGEPAGRRPGRPRRGKSSRELT